MVVAQVWTPYMFVEIILIILLWHFLIRLFVLCLGPCIWPIKCPFFQFWPIFVSEKRRFTWWRHQVETFSALLALCAENSLVTGEFPHKGQWRGALVLSLICAWINGWVNNREAGDLRHHCAHFDVTVMINDTVLNIASYLAPWYSFSF